MLSRRLQLPPSGTETFFLWGPCLTGKTTLLRETYPDARRIDLLESEEYRRYLTHPTARPSRAGSSTSCVTSDHPKAPRQLARDHPTVGRRLVVCLAPRARRTEDGIEILPAADFAARLWEGELF